jgi:hypothetical protein
MATSVQTTTGRRTTPKRVAKPVDWPAVLMRAARHGLQIIAVDHEEWPRVMGTGARVVLDGNVIWMGSHARVRDLEVALAEADPHNHPFLKRPDEVAHIGGPSGRIRVLRREPRVDVDLAAL